MFFFSEGKMSHDACSNGSNSKMSSLCSRRYSAVYEGTQQYWEIQLTRYLVDGILLCPEDVC